MRAGACAALSGTSVSWTVYGLATHFGDLLAEANEKTPKDLAQSLMAVGRVPSGSRRIP